MATLMGGSNARLRSKAKMVSRQACRKEVEVEVEDEVAERADEVTVHTSDRDLPGMRVSALPMWTGFQWWWLMDGSLVADSTDPIKISTRSGKSWPGRSRKFNSIMPVGSVSRKTIDTATRWSCTIVSGRVGLDGKHQNWPGRRHPDGDKLYTGVRKLIAEHLDDLARKDIVPTFPRSGVMNSNTTLSTSFKTLGLGSSVLDEGPAASGSSGPNVRSIESALEGERFLKALKAVWDDHVSSMDKLSKILKYMVGFRASVRSETP
jgi:hypothetical protein